MEQDYALPTQQPYSAEPYAASPLSYAARAKAAGLRAYGDAAARSFGARGELSSDLDAINQLEDFDYSPEALQYLQAQQAALTGYTGPYNLSSMDLHQTDLQTGAAMPYTSSYLEQAAMRGDPLSRSYASFDPSTGQSAYRGSNTIQFDPTGSYRLVDRSTGNVVSSGAGWDAGRDIVAGTKAIGDDKGAKANWDVQRQVGDVWNSIRDHDPETSGFGTFLKIALPILTGGTLAPLMGGGALGAGLASAAGSAAAGTLMGDSLGDILKSAALSGVTAGGLQALSGALPGGPLNNVSHSGVANAIGSGANNAITVIGNAASAAAPSFAGGLANSLYSGSNNAPASNASPGGLESNFDGIIVKGASNGSLLGGPGALASGFPSTLQGALSAAQPGYANLAGQMPTEDIVAEGVRQQGLSDVGKTLVGGAALAGAGVAAAPSGGATSSAGASATEAAGGSAGAGTLSQISKYLEMAGYGTSVLGALFGGKGGGSGSAGTIPGGFGGVNPVFKTTLPQANLPGVGDMSPRVMPQQDWNTYAMRPEQSFFNNVPQNVQGYADGGDVRGPGTGRSDSIPAALSDGEYVMDAETVALLGDGSTNAGADMLDQFRINIRKHKGKHLSKGKISPDAKAPEHYLSGGLA